MPDLFRGPVCVTLPNFVQISQAVAEISRCLDFIDWRPPLSWIMKFHILTVGRVRSVELRHHGKFRVDRSNHCRDITIFRLFQDVGLPPSWICDACVETTHEGHLMVVITVQNLVGIDTVVLILYKFFEFASLA